MMGGSDIGPDRWKRIEQLYNEALERRPEERSSFLAQACRGDEELRREVEGLLDHLEKGRSFLSSPAMDHILDTEVLAHYRIVKKLAAGGRGVSGARHEAEARGGNQDPARRVFAGSRPR